MALAGLAALAVPATAFAGNPSDGGALGVSGGVGGPTEAAGNVGGAAVSNGLPFTGLDLGLVIGVGLALVVLGVLLRRRSAHS